MLLDEAEFSDKGSGGIGRWHLATSDGSIRTSTAGTGLQAFPDSRDEASRLSPAVLDRLGQEYNASLPDAIVQRSDTHCRTVWTRRETTAISLRGRMIALQEELDWQCYHLYGLLSEDLRYDGDDLPELSLGQRAFEIVMARQMAKGELETSWFERHGSTPITELPSHWSDAYRRLVERRIEIIETNKEIGLIETTGIQAPLER